jgi:DNA-binding LytR/AlgR family response regulator
MKVLIIEDEKFAVQRLSSFLQQSEKQIDILATTDTVEASVNFLNTAPELDLIFMDIALGDGKSFEIFEKTAVQCPVIFITAFDEYAIQAFKHNSIDYLLKPLKKEELEYALNKFRTQHVQRKEQFDFTTLLAQFREKRDGYRTRFMVKKGTRLFSINAEEIAFFYTKERLQYLKTFEKEDYIIENNLDELEEQLDPAHFFRVNRQFIISHPAIDKMHLWFDGKIKLSVTPAAYEDIIISRLRANDFKKWLGK